MKPSCPRSAATGAAVAFLMLLWPVDVRAQHAVVFGAYYAPFYYPYFHGSWFYGYGWYPPYGYQFGYADTSVRVQVTPRETEVFVDGYYAGRVDDFDGVFQRLHVEPGEHEIQLYLPGHRIATQRVYLQPGGSFNIRRAMEPLAAGESEPFRPEPAQPSNPGPSPRTATPGGAHAATRVSRRTGKRQLRGADLERARARSSESPPSACSPVTPRF